MSPVGTAMRGMMAAAAVGGDGSALWMWGANSNGDLGDGTTTSRSSPVQIGTSGDWSSVSMGYGHSVGVKTDGTLWSWGTGVTGRTGLGNTTKYSSPVQIGDLLTWNSVFVGAAQSFATKTDGTLWSWGANTYGQLGDGTVINRSSPVQIGSLTDWSVCATGNRATHFIKTDGTLWGVGDSSSGRLGDGQSATNFSSPIQIGADSNWASISAGKKHIHALRTDGTLWAWGFGGSGGYRLGVPGSGNQSSPIQVGALTDWADVSAGEFHNLGVKTTGELFAWGFSGRGVLGDGQTMNNLSSPIQIGADTNWSKVFACTRHSLALKTDGTFWAWGDNSPSGQLGDGTITDRSSPVQVGALTNWTGGDHGWQALTSLGLQ